MSPVTEDFCTSLEDPVPFVSVKPGGASRQWYAVCDLPDDAAVYGGWKEDRLLSISEIARALAGPSLDYQVGTFQVELADDDYAIRDFLAGGVSQYYARWEVEAYMITPAGRKIGAEAHRIATGLADGDPEFDTQAEGMTVRLNCRDAIGIAMNWTSTGQGKLPRRVLTNTVLPGLAPALVGKGAWLPWGTLTTRPPVAAGLLPPDPDGYAPRGSVLTGDPTIPVLAGWAPWDPAVAAVTGFGIAAVAGGDCPARDYAAQVFPVSATDAVGDPVDYVAGATPLTIAAGPNQTVEVTWTASPDAVKYYVVLFAFSSGQWRPQQIIETTGTTVDFDHAFDTPSPGTGLATGAVLVVGNQFYYYSARTVNGINKSAWTSGVLNNTNLQFGYSFALPNGKIRPVRLYWDPAVGAASYEILKTTAGPSTPLIFVMPITQVEAGLVYWDEDFDDTDALPTPAVPPREAGRLKVEYTRDVVLPDAQTWHELLIAGAAIQGLDDWYYDDGATPAAVEINLDDGTAFLFPKAGTAWDAMFGPVYYRDVTGSDGVVRRFTLGYCIGAKGDLVAAGTSLLTVNLRGLEAAGDCTGTLIEDLHDIAQHLLNYFALAPGEGYTTGLWGTPPALGLSGAPIVDAASFDAVKTMRLGEIPGGLVAAGVTGAGGELVDTAEELKRLMRSGDFRMGPSKTWQIMAAAIDEAKARSAVTTVLDDVEGIQFRTFKPSRVLNEMGNRFTYRYHRDYAAAGGWSVDNQVYVNQPSITNWGRLKPGEDLDFEYLDEPAVVGHVLGKHARRRADAPGYVVVEGDLCLLDDPPFELGGYFKIKHWRGVQMGGWVDRLMWVVGSTFVPATRRIRLLCLDISNLLTAPTPASHSIAVGSLIFSGYGEAPIKIRTPAGLALPPTGGVLSPTSGDRLTRSNAYLNLAADWTRFTYVQPTAPIGPTDFVTSWILGDETYGSPYVWLGCQQGTFMFALEAFDGTTYFDSTPTTSAFTLGAYTALAVRYTAATHVIDVIADGAIVATLAVDLSTFVFTGSDDALLNDGASVGGIAGTRDRVWQAALTLPELIVEAGGRYAVRTANLLADTPLESAADVTDHSGNGRDWTAIGTPTSLPFAWLGTAAGTGGCEGIVALDSGEVFASGIGDPSPTFYNAAAYTAALAFVAGQLNPTAPGYGSIASDYANNFYVLLLGGGVLKLSKFSAAGALLSTVQLEASWSGFGSLGVNPAGTIAYYVHRATDTVYKNVIAGPTVTTFVTETGYVVWDNGILVLRNGDVLIAWRNGLRPNFPGYVKHYSAAGALLHTYALSLPNPDPVVLTPGLTDASFWVAFYDSTLTTFGKCRIAEVAIGSGAILHSFDPDDLDSFDFDGPFCVARQSVP